MSQQTVQNIIGRAVMDAAFRSLLFSDPDKAFEGYDLTEEEKTLLRNLDADEVSGFAGKLDERITKVKMKMS
jgi:hypothetical protein